MHPAAASLVEIRIQSEARAAVGRLLVSRAFGFPRRWMIAFAEESARQLKAWAAEERAKLGLPDVD